MVPSPECIGSRHNSSIGHRVRSIIWYALALCTSPIVAVQPVAAQALVSVPSEIACGSCTIEFIPTAQLGDLNDPLSLQRGAKVAMDSEGRFVVGRTFGPDQIAAYDPEGRLLRTFGRSGEGPGEFNGAISSIRTGWGDTIHVFERNRHTILSPGIRDFVRLRALPLPVLDAVHLPDGRMVLHPVPLRREGRAFQVLSREGEIEGSMGELLDPDAVYAGVRRLAPATNGGFWSGKLNRYEIQRMAADGRVDVTLRRSPAWFRPWSGPVQFEGLEEPPRPRLTALAEDPAGRLWVIIRVPDRNWQRTVVQGGEYVIDGDTPAASDLYDTIVEVIDVSEGKVLARSRLDRSLEGLVGENGIHAHGSRVDSTGLVVIDVWRLELQPD